MLSDILLESFLFCFFFLFKIENNHRKQNKITTQIKQIRILFERFHVTGHVITKQISGLFAFFKRLHVSKISS